MKRQPTREELEAETKRLLEENNRLLRDQNDRLRSNPATSGTRAQPVSKDGSNNFDSYTCSKCGVSCYYDGRCGDGPILMCDCNAAEDAYWANDRR